MLSKKDIRLDDGAKSLNLSSTRAKTKISITIQKKKSKISIYFE